jgi:hypothetical protein
MILVRTPCEISRRANSARRCSCKSTSCGDCKVTFHLISRETRSPSRKPAADNSIPVLRDQSAMQKKTELRRALPPTRWAGVGVLETAHRLNIRCIELLAEVASTEKASGSFRAVFGCQELWARMDAPARERASRAPLVLLDLGFDSDERWSRGPNCGAARRTDPEGLFGAEGAVSLVREIVTEARTAAQSQPGAARLVFGMSVAACGVVSDLTGSEIDRIATGCFQSLRPRWHTNEFFWRKVLEAAVSSDMGRAARIPLLCVQLLGSDLAIAH